MSMLSENRVKVGVRKSAAAALVLSLVAAVTLVLAAPAHAVAVRGYGQQQNLTVGNVWLGSHIVNGRFVWCAIQPDKRAPDPDFGWYITTRTIDGSAGGVLVTSGLGGSAITGAKQSGPNLDQVNGSPGIVQNGSTLSGTNLNRIGYVLGRYGNTTDATTARALKTLLLEKGRSLPLGVYNSDNGGSSQPDLQHNRGFLRTDVDNMWNEAINYAGPYAAAPNFTVTVNANGAGGTVSGIGFRSASGYWVPGYSWTAVITSGNATWSATGTATVTGITSTTELSRAFSATTGASGEVVVQLQIANVPDHRVFLYESVNSLYQDVIFGGVRNLSTGAISEREVFDEVEVSVATTTSHAIATPGTALTDRLVVTVPTPFSWPVGHTAQVVSTLYGPFTSTPANQATVPAVAPVVGSVTTTITGPGTYTTGSVTITQPGYYVWHETIAADEHLKAWSGRFGVASETTLVPWSPSITTSISSQALAAGEDVADAFTITGGRPGQSVTVTGRLYLHPGPDAPVQQATVPTGAVEVGSTTQTVTIGSGGSITGTLPAIPHGDTPGHYTWVVSTPASTTMNAYTSDYGIPSESGLLPWSPQIETTISSDVLEVDVPVEDAFTITGGRPGESVTVTGEFYRHGEPDAPIQQATVPDDAVLVGTTTATVTIGADGTATGMLPEISHDNIPAYYTWVVSTPASATMNAYTSDYGISSETGVLAWRPQITTVIDDQALTFDVDVADAFTITGGRPGESVTVTGEFYRHGEHTAPVQQVTVPDDAVLMGTTSWTVTIDADGTATGTLPAMAHGNIPAYYTWVVSTPGSTTMDAYTSDYGIPAETGVLVAEPSIVTQISAGLLSVGVEVEDAFTITSGRPGLTVEVTGQLYRHGELTAPVQQSTVPADAVLVGTTTTTVTLDDDGIATGELSLPHDDTPGYYTWVVSTPASDVMNAYTSDYGIPEETGLLQWEPFVVTTAASSHVVTVEQGSRAATAAEARPLGVLSVVDGVKITGLPADYGALPDEDIPVTMSLYFVHHSQASTLADLADMCVPETLVYTTQLDTAEGEWTTEPYEIPLLLSDAQDGFWMWVHSHPGSTRLAAFQGECGEAAETLYLTPSAITTSLALTGADTGLLTWAAALLTAGAAALFVRQFTPSRNQGGRHG